jgi:trigger factor
VSAEGEPTGPVQRGAQLVMADTSLRDELRAAILGRTVGPEPVRVELTHQHDADDEHAHDHDDHTDRFDFTLTEIRRRVLPPLDAAFVQAQTGGRTEDVDELRADIRRELERSWERRATESLEAKMVEEFVDAHAFPVPYTLVEAVLDQRLDDLRERGQGKLPAAFDVEGYRERMRESAERQVRWLLVKERLVEAEGLDVTDEDLDAEFARLAGDEMEPAVVRQFFSRQPGQLEQVTDHLLNRRVFESLGRRFQVVEKSREDLERERAENPVALTAAEPEDDAPDAEGSDADAEPGEDKPKKRGLFGFGRKKED